MKVTKRQNCRDGAVEIPSFTIRFTDQEDLDHFLADGTEAHNACRELMNLDEIDN